jgi:hypothetical protein
MRTTGICSKCGHNRILLCKQVPDTGEQRMEIEPGHYK